MSRPLPVWLVATAALAVALAIWVIAVPVAGIELRAGTPPQTIGVASVAVTTLVVTLAAWAVRALLRRRTPVAWWLTCAIVLLISLLGPLGASSRAAVGTLLALHLAVGAVLALGLDPRRSRQRLPARVP
ncbi:DUF6069 family protein [Cellulomonas sp. Root137]|uniref:DUF6069 family protein n=1 Tax=Cellulomonas sp. Root137 TaxID=1736459 RepID=UPI0006FDBA83|nr:DUF6069 family protein [Cellulomonas sp. Root137]KQY46604.1 hypothetical protein ASD18_04035 [Cellulomonas sp. Root137]KRD43754.1 hypothetical protein ASE38_05990 [Cellulomonas sp. Root930]